MQLSLSEHLSELRKRIFKALIALVVATIFSYLHVDKIVDIIIKPAKGLDFVYLSPPELFLAYIKISLITGLIISSPVILLEVWLFIQPGLKPVERKYVIFSMLMAIVFFLLGIVFGYYIVVPVVIDFFTKMSVERIEPMLSFAKYISFMGTLLLAFGFTFEFPLLIILLSQLELITPKTLRHYKKIFILVSFIIGAAITPPDVISQVLVALPLILLYEISIIFSTLIYKRKLRREKVDK